MSRIILLLIIMMTMPFAALVMSAPIQGVNSMQCMNPLLPFAFTYDYRLPTEWQLDLLVGATIDPQLINSLMDQSEEEQQGSSILSTGQLGAKMGFPGDIVVMLGWPWLGGYFSVPETRFMPEFDISLAVPLTFGMNSTGTYQESFTFNAILKKSLPPIRFSTGYSLLIAPGYPQELPDETSYEVGKGYIGLGIEWFINPYIKLLGEYRFQLTSLLYTETESGPIKFELPPALPDHILGIGLEYTLETDTFTMKANLGYAVSLLPPMEETVPFGTQGISFGFSFLFPFPFSGY